MSPFAKNMLTILRGSVLGQLIVFVSLPLLSRLFPPAAFGSLQSIQAVLSLLLIVCSLRLEIAVLSCTDEELKTILSLCIALCCLVSLFSCAVVGILWLFFPQTLAQVGTAVLLIPFSLLFAGFGQILTYLGLRLQQFSITATAKIVQSSTYVAAASLLGSVFPSAFVLTFADLVARIALVGASMRGEFFSTFKQCAPLKQQTLLTVRPYMHLPLVSMPSAIINVLGSSFTAVMLISLFSASEAGNYAMVERALGAPIAAIASAASQAFMAALSKQRLSAVDNRSLFVKIVKTHAVTAAVPTLILLFSARPLAPLLLGPAWEMAGIYAQILAPMLYVSFLTMPVNMTLVLCGKQSWQLRWDALRLAALGIMWGIISWGSYSSIFAVAAYSVITTVFYASHLLLSYKALVLRAVNEGTAS